MAREINSRRDNKYKQTTMSVSKFNELRSSGKLDKKVKKEVDYSNATMQLEMIGRMIYGRINNLKPLSVNEVWQGKRFKTTAYTKYEEKLLKLLKNAKLPPAPYKVTFEFKLSNMLADWDNPIKPFQDILQKRYKFNDKDIMQATVVKKIVKKGEEGMSFTIDHYTEND